MQGSEKHANTLKQVREMWVGIQQKILDLKPPWGSLRIYQEALPVCGREAELVTRLSLKGSHNHRLICSLLRHGARIEGTEDPNLLVREYDLLSKAFHAGEGRMPLADYRKESDKILAERDEFIAGRIRQTLKPGEVGLVFLGVRHQLDRLLEKDFEIVSVIYMIPFDTVKTVYNL